MKHKEKTTCAQSSVFYYDYLQQNLNDIDHNIVSHIEKCAFCQSRIKDLKVALDSKNVGITLEDKKQNTAIINILASHFNLANRPITCEIAKYFMPNISSNLIDIKIDTPITMHIKNCFLCQKDMEVINNLELTSKQLACLSRIFASQTFESQDDCEKYIDIIHRSFGKFNFDTKGISVLKHISTCVPCRNKFYKSQEKLLEKLQQKHTDSANCQYDNLANKDFFNYCFPYSINGEKSEPPRTSKEFLSHITTCPLCLRKMLEIHQKIFAILDRPKSGIVTEYMLCKQKMDENVNLTTKQPPHGAITKHFKRIAKPATAVAAMFLVAIWLYFGTTAKAIEYKDIYDAIKTVKDICFITGETEIEGATQKIWISKDLGIKLFNSGNKWVLWDVTNRQTKTYNPTLKTMDIQKIDCFDTIKAENIVNVPNIILPFQYPSALPEKYGWKFYDDPQIDSFGGIYTCELLWSANLSDGTKMDYKWRVQVDKNTMQPKRVENWRKPSSIDIYKLQSWANITYPLKGDIAKLLIELDEMQ